MLSRDSVKGAFQQAGLFPWARSAYRRVSPQVRLQKRREVAFYGNLLRPNGLCFDVGANLGQRSEAFLELNNRVLLVEPNANCRSTIDYLFARNPRVCIVDKAVGAQEGATEIYAHGTDSTASVDPDWDSKVFGFERGSSVHLVPMTTLDALISEHGRPDFIKIDVEALKRRY